MSNFTTGKAVRLAKGNDTPDPTDVDNSQEFLNGTVSLKENFIINTKDTYSALEADGKPRVQCAGDRMGRIN